MSACDDVFATLAEGAPLEGPLAIHAVECAECRKLRALDRALAHPEPFSVEPSPALRAEVARSPRVRRWSTWERAALPVATLVASVIIVGLVTRGDFRLVGGSLVVALVSGLAFLAGLALTFYRGQDGLGASATTRWGFAGGALGFAALLGFAQPFLAAAGQGMQELGGAANFGASHPLPQLPPAPALAASLLKCTSIGVLVALAIGAVLLFAARRTAPAAPVAAGAAAGAAAGLGASLVLSLQCTGANTPHLIVAHGAPILVGAMLGMLFGRRALAP